MGSAATSLFGLGIAAEFGKRLGELEADAVGAATDSECYSTHCG
jgi:hypothetical protein